MDVRQPVGRMDDRHIDDRPDRHIDDRPFMKTTGNRLLLTGTPLQNNLVELWSNPPPPLCHLSRFWLLIYAEHDSFMCVTLPVAVHAHVCDIAVHAHVYDIAVHGHVCDIAVHAQRGSCLT